MAEPNEHDDALVQKIVVEALKLANPALREEFLRRVCGDDAAQKQRVCAELLADAPTLVAADAAETPTVVERVVGPYTLVQILGAGGMGEVWLARQTVPVQRQVALKLIKTGVGGESILRRFEAERQALALMDHPNIAKVHDAGAAADGTPYFVMELVAGKPLGAYCDAKRLPLRARLELLLPICRAVQHAHLKGVAHRDLKPANILVAEVDGKPVPKIIDFGVAKALDRSAERDLEATDPGAVIGTLEYMSPEQASGDPDIDSRTDVYALGIILYELLTGLRPHAKEKLKDRNFLEALELIVAGVTPTPKTRLSESPDLPALAAKRGTEPAKLLAAVGGELQWIVAKCLEKDRDRRYATAKDLEEDLLCHLHDLPVNAQAPTWRY
jgi:serine/threonine protein kinase